MGITNPSLRTRIYFSMLAIILLSLVVTGIATITYFKNQNDDYHSKRLARQETRVISTIEYFLQDSELEANLDTYFKDFGDKIFEIADVNNLSINIYNNQGEMLMSSLSDEEDPNFFKRVISNEVLDELSQKEHVLRENRKDNQVFLSAYSYIKNDKGQRICIINLPYSRSDAANKQELRDFLTYLVVIYVFLLVGASILAYLLSNYITKSLRVIAEKIKTIGINKKNEQIQWKGHDEIGSLVAEYNKMIDELESSANRLAQSERESAWREMAKQVAHEIKNPLTPMKLSVQHLERSYDPADPDFSEKMERFATKMIQQIDTLSTIANEFSNFAKMPKARINSIDFLKVMHASIELYAETEKIRITFDNQTGKEELFIAGDDEQLTRVFNNLIRNSIQAIPPDRKGEIKVVLGYQQDGIKVQVQDNGTGIEPHQRDKIFVPNFTTKTSGSGLGLAMVKSIVENHNGKVWFETDPPNGTSFFVTLPCRKE